MPHRVSTAELLEREHELRQLSAALSAAKRGSGRATLIEGSAGIGKTALLGIAEAVGRRRGFQVVAARGDRLEAEFSFGVCLQLFSQLASEPNREELFAGAAAHSRSLFEGAPAAWTPGEDRTLSLIHGLYWLAANLAERTPLLLAVDDAHWADPLSLRFLYFLVRRLEGLPVLVVATRRTGEATPGEEFLTGLAKQPACSALGPMTLSPGAVTRLVEESMGQPEPDFSALCHELSGGNPLYLRELLRTALESGFSPTKRDAARLSSLSPGEISTSVLARLRRLGETPVRLARAAAVAGERLSLRDAAMLAGIQTGEARAAADALAKIEILAPGEPLRFAHPLVRTAVYDWVSEAERAALHLRAAGLLRGTDGPVEVVAGQLLNAERGAGPWVLDALRSAAQEAMARGSPTAAARYLRRALEERPARETRGDVLVALGLAETEAGDPAGVERITQAAALLKQPEQRAGARLMLGIELSMAGRFAEATDAFERGLGELADPDSPLALSLQVFWATATAYHAPTRKKALSRIEALLLAPDLDKTATGRLLLAQAAAERGYQGGSIAELRELAARAIAPGMPYEPGSTFWAYTLAGGALNMADELDQAERAIDMALELARKRGSVSQAALAYYYRSMVRIRSGRVADAIADAQTSLEAMERGWRALAPVAGVLARALLERGEIAQASAVTTLPGGDESWRDQLGFGWVLHARGRIAFEQGEAETALRWFLECGELWQSAGLTNPVTPWRSGAALAAARLARQEQALGLAEEEVRLARAFGARRAIGIALRALGLVVGGDEGIELLREAVEVLEASPARLEHARALVDLGAALRRAGHRREGREPLREGLELARHCGALALVERAHAELRVSGARPRRLELTGVDALTPSERRIAQMAAEGLTNPQIAQALFLTRRTVEMHLTSAYRKLEISSRDQLQDALDPVAVGGRA